MKNGHFMKEKGEYLRELFSTREGLADFFIGSFIWGFIAVRYTTVMFGWVKNFFSFLPQGVICDYFSYLAYGVFLAVLGWVISFTINKIFKVIIK